MSGTKDMMRKHSAFYKAKRDAAAGITATTDPKSTFTSSHADLAPPAYGAADLESPFSDAASHHSLPTYTRTEPRAAPPPSMRKGHRLSDFFGAAFTGYIPKERAPAFEVFEPRRKESMGANPGAVEVRRCTGGMSSSGKAKEGKKEGRKGSQSS